MKAILCTLLLVVAGVYARSTIKDSVVMAEGPGCPIDDPLDVEGPGPANVTLDPLVRIDVGATRGDIHAIGLSTLKYNVDIKPLLLTATFEVDLGKVDVTTTYEATGYIDARPLRQETIPGGNFTGKGDLALDSASVHLKGRASLFVNLIGNKVTVSNLNIEAIRFAHLNVNLGADFTIGGVKIDWAELSKNFKQNFDQDFAQHKTAFTEKFRLAANNIIGKFTLLELIDLVSGGGGGEGGDEPCEN